MSLPYLFNSAVEAVLQICDPILDPILFSLPASFLCVKFYDGKRIPPQKLRQAVDFIQTQRTSGRKILVCCGRGISRSPSLVAAYLYEQGMDLMDAYLSILQHRRLIVPHIQILRSFVEYYGLSIRAEEILIAVVKARKELMRPAL
jgi:protein-tyrosine phosphatase